MAWKGKFRPKNPHKYAGDINDIVYRSSWELKVMRKFDTSESVTQWASECLAIPYYDPVKRRARRYFPDFVVRKKDGSTMVVEVKPLKESSAPTHKKGKRRSSIIKEELTWATNKAKWEAATRFCERNGWQFVVLTEKEIFD